MKDRFKFNLFSVTRMLVKGFKLKGDKKSISIFKGVCSFEFNIIIHTKHDTLYCAIMKRKLANDYSEMTNASVSDETPVKEILKTSMKRAHKCLGHLGEMMTHAAAFHLGMTLSRGALPVCESCAMAKAHQGKILKDISDDSKALKFNGQVCHNLSTIKVPDEFKGITIAKSNWNLMVDEASKFQCSKFL